MRRKRSAKIVATLGPSSSDAETIHKLHTAGADVFRLNLSHGSHEDHRERVFHIRNLERRVERRFESLERRMPRAVGPRSGVGAMQAFVPFDGSPEVVKAVLKEAYDQGLIMLSTGSSPMKIRMLPPVNTTDEELESAFSVLECALAVVGEARGLC